MMTKKKGLLIAILVTIIISGLCPAFAEEALAGPTISEQFPTSLVKESTPVLGAKLIGENEIAIEEVSLSIDGAPSVTGFTYDSSTGVLSIKWPIPLQDGQHTATMVAKDITGASSTLSWQFNVDTLPPIITGGVPEEGSKLVYTTNSVSSIYAYCTDANSVREARLYYNDTKVACTVMNWGATQLAYSGFQDLADGLYNVRLELEDFAGNITVRQWQLDIQGLPNIVPVSPKGVTITYTPTIEVDIRDYKTGVDPNSIYLSIDGGPELNMAPFFNTRTNKLIYPLTTPVTPERHTVKVRAKCKMGHEATSSWDFWYDFEPPTISSVTLIGYPSQGKNFVVKEGDILPRGKDLTFYFNTSEQLSNLQMTLNGVPIQAKGSYIYSSRLYNTLWSLNMMTLKDGPHTFRFEMTDAGFNKAVYELNFVVAELPVVSNEKPVNLAKIPLPDYNFLYYYNELTDRRFEAVVKELQPIISMKITDGNDQITTDNIIFKLDGIVTPFSYDADTGTLSCVPTEPLENEAVHAVEVTVTDEAGNRANESWRFYINTYPTMKWNTNQTCVSCHSESGAAHFPTATQQGAAYETNCGDCHGTYGARTMNQRCIACHRDYWHVTVYPKSTFHEVSHYDQTGIPTVTLDTAHRTESACTPCHAKSINREHAQAGRTDPAGNPITCDTCHMSSSEVVQRAITDGQTNCSGCHQSNGEGHEALHTTRLDSNCTATCHKGSLTKEHMDNPKTQTKSLDCDTCHNSTNPIVLTAIVNNQIECVSCHWTAHNLAISPAPNADIPMMPGIKWTTPMPASLWTGEVPSWSEGGYVLISQASTMSGESVLNYYKEQMGNKDWSRTSTDPADLSRYELTFEKAGRRALVRFSRVTNGDSPVSRVVIVYK